MADEDKLSFLDETSEEPKEEVTAEEVEADPAEPTEEAPAEPEPEAEPDTGEEEAAPPVAEEEKQTQAIPVTALLDEREKRQLAERRAEETARQLQQLQAQLQQRAEPAPDWLEDPQAAAQYQAQTIEQRMQAQTLAQSRFFAEREFGKELVDEAYAYFDQNPHLSHQLLQSPSPFHAAVETYKRQKFLSEVGENPDAYRESLKEQLRQEIMAEAAQPSKPKAPPPSMNKTPSAGRDAITPGSAFDMMLPD